MRENIQRHLKARGALQGFCCAICVAVSSLEFCILSIAVISETDVRCNALNYRKEADDWEGGKM